MNFLGKRILSAVTNITFLVFVDDVEGPTAPRKPSTVFSNCNS